MFILNFELINNDILIFLVFVLYFCFGLTQDHNLQPFFIASSETINEIREQLKYIDLSCARKRERKRNRILTYHVHTRHLNHFLTSFSFSLKTEPFLSPSVSLYLLYI